MHFAHENFEILLTFALKFGILNMLGVSQAPCFFVKKRGEDLLPLPFAVTIYKTIGQKIYLRFL